MKTGNRQTMGTIMALVGDICWDFSGRYGQFLSEQKAIQASWLVTMHLFFTGILLILMGFKLNGKENFNISRKKQGALRLLVFVISGVTLCQYTYFMTIQASSTGTATVLRYLPSVLILLVVRARGKCLPGGLKLGVIGLSLLGTFVIGTRRDTHTFHIPGEALFWDLLIAVSSMIYIMIPGGLVLKYDIYQVLGSGMFMGGIAMGIFVCLWTCAPVWDTGTVGALAGMTVVGTALAFGLFLQGVSLVDPLRGSIMGSVEPVSAVIISVFWLNMSLTPADSIGFALTLGAVFMLTFPQRPGSLKETGAGVTDGIQGLTKQGSLSTMGIIS